VSTGLPWSLFRRSLAMWGKPTPHQSPQFMLLGVDGMYGVAEQKSGLSSQPASRAGEQEAQKRGEALISLYIRSFCIYCGLYKDLLCRHRP